MTEAHETIEYRCRKCGAVVAKRQGNLIFTDGQLMSLFHGGFAFPCTCGEHFYIDLRHMALPTRGQIRRETRDSGGKMLWAA